MDSSKKTFINAINIAIVLFLMFGFGYVVEPFSTVTPVGVKVLGAFLGMVYGWCTLGMAWPSLLCMVAIATSGLVGIQEVSAQAFGNYLLFFLIIMMIVVDNLSQSGFTTKAAMWLVTRDFVKGHPWRLIITMSLVTYLLGGFSQAFATIFLMWELWYGIIRVVGYQPFDKFTTCMLTGTILCVVLGSLTMPFHQLPLIFLTTFGNMIGETANYATWIAVVVPFTLFLLAQWILMIKFVYKLDVSKLENFDVTSLLEKGEDLTFTKHQKATAIGLGVMIVLLVLPGILPKSLAFVSFLNNAWGPLGTGIVVMVAMMFITVDGKPVLDLPKVARQAVNWDVVFFFAMVMYISTVLTHADTGISPFFVSVVSPLVASRGPIVFILMILAIGAVITNFFNNTVTGLLLLNVFAMFLPSIVGAGISVWAIVPLLLTAVNMAFWTPVACPTASLLYGNNLWVKKADVFKVIFPISICWILSILFIMFPFANFMYM